MAENSSSGGSSIASAPARSDDPTWAHGQVIVGAKNSCICVYCSKRINGGGITRLKQHLAGIKGQVEACKKVPADVNPRYPLPRVVVNNTTRMLCPPHTETGARGKLIRLSSLARLAPVLV